MAIMKIVQAILSKYVILKSSTKGTYSGYIKNHQTQVIFSALSRGLTFFRRP